MAITQTSEKKTAMKYDPIKAFQVPLTPYEQEIEDATLQSAPELNEPLREAASETLRALRGGKRAGSGRKPRPHIRTTVLLAPAARRKLDAMAKKKGSLSAAVEALLEQA
jgi:hypothetical protein